MANTRLHHQIYNAAKEQDHFFMIDRAGKTAAPKHRVNFIMMSPLFRLAAEGEAAAVEFLLQYGYPLGDALAGYAFSQNQQRLDEIQHKYAERDELLYLNAYLIKGYALANDTHAINRILNAEPKLAHTVCMIYAEHGKTTAVEELTKKYKIRQDEICKSYARGGHDAQVNVLIAHGANPAGAYHEYLKFNHQSKAHQLLVRTQYDRQLKNDKARVNLVILFAIILTPLSLLISLPLLFWARRNDPIQCVEVPERDINTVKYVRSVLRHGQDKLKYHDSYIKKVSLGNTNGVHKLLLDKPQAERFKLFSEQDTYAITRPKKKVEQQKNYLRDTRTALKAKSALTHQWLASGHPFADDTQRVDYRDYMANPLIKAKLK